MKTKISSDVINIDRFQSFHNKQWNSQNSKTYIYKWYGIRSHHWRLSLKWTSSNSCLSLYIQTHAHYTETESETGDGQNQTWLIFIYCFARRGCCFFFFVQQVWICVCDCMCVPTNVWALNGVDQRYSCLHQAFNWTAFDDYDYEDDGDGDGDGDWRWSEYCCCEGYMPMQYTHMCLVLMFWFNLNSMEQTDARDRTHTLAHTFAHAKERNKSR